MSHSFCCYATQTNCSSAGADVLFDGVVAARFGVRWAPLDSPGADDNTLPNPTTS